MPLRHERIRPDETPIGKAVALYDAQYGCAPCDKLVRVRSNLCLWGAPPPYPGRGRPARHGKKFKLGDVSTWSPPDETLQVNDPTLGAVRLRLWRDQYFKRAADHPLQVLRVERLGWLGEPPPP